MCFLDKRWTKAKKRMTLRGWRRSKVLTCFIRSLLSSFYDDFYFFSF
ncbi:hypothetical protein Hanom_Chr05g00433171 [Helianthus anomalus]